MASQTNLNFFNDDDTRRINEAVRAHESHPDRFSLPRSAKPGDVPFARVRLLTDLEHGRSAIGRLLSLYKETGEESSIYQWLQLDQEIEVFCACYTKTRWNTDEEVTAVLTSTGWAVIENVLMASPGYLIDRDEVDLVPYGVYLAGTASEGIIQLEQPDSYVHRNEYVFLGDVDPIINQRFDNAPNGDGQPKVWPCSNQLPLWVAYEETLDSSIPEEIVNAFQWTATATPQYGEFWAPDHSCKIRRSLTLLELYWYKWTPPDPLPSGATNPGNRYWIAPIGWSDWGWGGWGYANWGWNGSYWSFPPWSAANSFPYYWGGYGSNWWYYRWGAFPPGPTDPVFNTSASTENIPQPTQGTISRLCRYGWVVWQGGWKIIGVNANEKLAFIIGDLQYNITTVVEEVDPTNCPEDAGT